jgi:hypothetical protein
MNCDKVQSSLSTFVDSGLPESERRAVSVHLAECRECEGQAEELRDLRGQLRSLPMALSPQMLASRLRVLASHEIARRRGEREFSSGFRRWLTRARISMRDLMRPLALPAAGGVLSSIVFFVMLVDTFGFQQVQANDIPLGVYTQVTVDQLSPFGFSSHDMTVELTIDKEGHVESYSPHGTFTRDDIKQLGNLILFTSFAPATSFGQPTSGKVLVRSHRINVRG